MSLLSFLLLLTSIEKILEQYPKIIDLITSIGTWAAVIVSLWLAKRNDHPSITATAFLKREAYGASTLGQPFVNLRLKVRVRNKGPQSAYFDDKYFAFWKEIFIKRYFFHDTGVLSRNPVEIPSGKSYEFALYDDTDFLYSDLISDKGGLNIKKFISLRLKLLRLYVITASGQCIRVKLDPSIKEKLLESSKYQEPKTP